MSLFVGNISKNVRKSDLAEDFEKFGKCEINFKVLKSLPAILLSMLFLFSPILCFYLLTPILIGIVRFRRI